MEKMSASAFFLLLDDAKEDLFSYDICFPNDFFRTKIGALVCIIVDQSKFRKVVSYAY